MSWLEEIVRLRKYDDLCRRGTQAQRMQERMQFQLSQLMEDNLWLCSKYQDGEKGY